MKPRILSLFLAGMLLTSAPRAEILVSAAASLSDVLPEIARAWEAAGGEKIGFNFAASSALVSQIEAGAPVDLLLTADEQTMGRRHISVGVQQK